MLRITPTSPSHYRLEGKLIGPWVDELATTLAPETTSNIELDLKNLAFVDAAGAHLLRSLLQKGARLTHPSDFISALLEAANP
ncbi:MAG: hypothetical protein ACTHN5_11540 [Phycisphaerae bacterium]